MRRTCAHWKHEWIQSICRTSCKKLKKHCFFSHFLRCFFAMSCKKWEKTVFFHVFRDTLYKVRKKCEKQRLLSFFSKKLKSTKKSKTLNRGKMCTCCTSKHTRPLCGSVNENEFRCNSHTIQLNLKGNLKKLYIEIQKDSSENLRLLKVSFIQT